MPFAHTLSKVSDAYPTYVRVAAYTSIGYGPYALPTPTHLRAAHRSPSAPTNVSATVNSATSVVVSWDEPKSDGGDAVESFSVQFDRLPTFTSLCGDGPELQTLTLTGSGPLISNGGGGGFKLVIDGDYSNPLVPTAGGCFPVNVEAATLQESIRALGVAYGSVEVSRGGDGSPAWDFGFVWSITFAANVSRPLPLGDLAVLTVNTSGCGDAATAGATYTTATLKHGLGYGGDCAADHLVPLFTYEVPLASASALVQPNSGHQFDFEVPRLTPGQAYYIRVAARNGLGLSVYTPFWSIANSGPAPDKAAASAVVPAAVPNLVRAVSLRSALAATSRDSHATNLRIGWAPPYDDNVLGNNGAPVTEYKIELATRVYETQSVQIVGGPYSAGSFSLMLEGNESYATSCMDWNVAPHLLELELNLLPQVDGASVSFASDTGTYTVVFNGTTLSNGAVPSLVASSCASFEASSEHAEAAAAAAAAANLDASFPVAVTTVTQGLAGYEPAVVVVSTSAPGRGDLDGYVAGMTGGYAVASPSATLDMARQPSQRPVSGTFDLSFGFTGDLTARLGGYVNETTVYGKVEAGSYLVQTSQDLRPYLNPGERVRVGEFVGIVNGSSSDYTCSSSPEDPAWPCTLPLTQFHPFGTLDAEDGKVELFGSDTSLGSVRVTQFNQFVVASRNLSFELLVGDSLQLHNSLDGSTVIHTVAGLSKDGLQVLQNFCATCCFAVE